VGNTRVMKERIDKLLRFIVIAYSIGHLLGMFVFNLPDDYRNMIWPVFNILILLDQDIYFGTGYEFLANNTYNPYPAFIIIGLFFIRWIISGKTYQK
jgi:hypothetical protein